MMIASSGSAWRVAPGSSSSGGRGGSGGAPRLGAARRPVTASAAAAAAAAAATRSSRRLPPVSCALGGWRQCHHHPHQHSQQQRRRSTVVVASSSSAAADANGGGGDDAESRGASKPASGAAAGGSGSTAAIAAAVAAVLATGVLNRVLYRIALVPLKDHVFALALFQALGYVAIYFGLLGLRYAQGKVTREMLAVAPKRRFVVTGACEAAAQLLMMAGAAHLPGALLPLLSQTGLLWQLAFSALLLGLRPTARQVVGVLMIVGGVALASLPASMLGGAAAAGTGAGAGAASSAAAALLRPEDLKYAALCVLSFALPSYSVIVKQQIFADARKALGRDLDVLVVNALGSAAQALFVIALLPLLTAARGLPLDALPGVVAEGARVFAGLPARAGASVLEGAPLFPLAYIAMNIAFNIAALRLVRTSSALTTGLTMAVMTPLSVAAFTLPLPLLAPAALGPAFWGGAGVLTAGLLLYNWKKGGGDSGK